MKTETIPDSPAPAQPVRRKNTRTLLITVGTCAALALGAVSASALIVQSNRDRDYAQMSQELADTQAATEYAVAVHASATGLSSLQYDEAVAFVKDVRALGKSASPILTAKQAKSLTEAADAADEAIGEKPAKSPEREAAVKTIQTAVKQARTADTEAAAAAKKAGKDAPAATAPGPYLTLDLGSVQELAGVPALASGNATAAPGRVTKSDLAKLGKELGAAKREHGKVQGTVDDETVLSKQYVDAVAAALPALEKVAAAAPEQAKAVIAAAPKAESENAAVTKAAEAAKKTAAAESTTSVQVETKLTAYVEAAKAAQQAHAAQVAAEEAAAAAQAAADQAAAEQAAAQQAPAPSYTPNWGGGAPASGGGGYVPSTPYTPPANPAPSTPVNPPSSGGSGGGGGSFAPPSQGGDGVCNGNCYL